MIASSESCEIVIERAQNMLRVIRGGVRGVLGGHPSLLQVNFCTTKIVKSTRTLILLDHDVYNVDIFLVYLSADLRRVAGMSATIHAHNKTSDVSRRWYRLKHVKFCARSMSLLRYCVICGRSPISKTEAKIAYRVRKISFRFVSNFLVRFKSMFHNNNSFSWNSPVSCQTPTDKRIALLMNIISESY